MSKRVQVTLTDEQFDALEELSRLRGMSMSAILAGPMSRLLPSWQIEIRELRKLRKQEATIAEKIERALGE